MSASRTILLLIFTVTSSVGDAIELPDQKASIALSYLSLTRTVASDSSKAYQLPSGLGIDYSVFLANKVTIFGQFEMNIEGSTQSVVLLGGAAGIAYYVLGGSVTRYRDLYVNASAEPKMNLFFGFGMSARTFDFFALDKEEKLKEGAETFSSASGKSTAQGSIFGLQVNVGTEIPVGFFLVPGLRVQYLQGLSSPTAPDLTALAIWFSLGFTI